MTLGRDPRGTVMVETLLAFMPLFTLFLGIVQYTLLAGAQLVVQHAAVAGVRAASVVLDDDPAHYGGAERLSIAGDESDAALGNLAALASALVPGAPTVPRVAASVTTGGRSYGPRMGPVRNAVYAKLAAIVPARAVGTLMGVPGVSVLDGLGTDPVLRLAQAPLYLPATTAITFPISPRVHDLFEERVDPAGLLTVRVTHVVTCTVPLVADIMCTPLGALLESESQELRADELRRAPGATVQAVPAFRSVRVKLLQAEASMPLQRAPYQYRAPGGAS